MSKLSDANKVDIAIRHIIEKEQIKDLGEEYNVSKSTIRTAVRSGVCIIINNAIHHRIPTKIDILDINPEYKTRIMRVYDLNLSGYKKILEYAEKHKLLFEL